MRELKRLPVLHKHGEGCGCESDWIEYDNQMIATERDWIKRARRKILFKYIVVSGVGALGAYLLGLVVW